MTLGNTDELDEYSEVSFLIQNGDRENNFKIIMKARPFEEGEDLEFNNSDLNIYIYDATDSSEVVQIIKDTTFDTFFKEYKIGDVNFDGKLDFYYVSSRGNANLYYTFWIWDDNLNKFAISYDLNKISMPEFDDNSKIVKGYWRGSAVSNETRFYRYIGEKLICIRSVEMGDPTDNGVQELWVKDFIDEKLVDVFNDEVKLTSDFSGEVYDRFFKWLDLEYTGEE